jgi:hypothetical protein
VSGRAAPALVSDWGGCGFTVAGLEAVGFFGGFARATGGDATVVSRRATVSRDGVAAVSRDVVTAVSVLRIAVSDPGTAVSIAALAVSRAAAELACLSPPQPTSTASDANKPADL